MKIRLALPLLVYLVGVALAEEQHFSSRMCTENGCIECLNGFCRESNNGKREVNHNTVTSKNCDNKGCHICVNGNCRYEARGKREFHGAMTYTEKSDTCETIEQSKCNCDNAQESCTRCDADDPNFCVQFYKGKLLTRKREVNHNTVNSTICDDNGCRICENGDCRYEARGKREASEVQYRSQSCYGIGRLHCTVCLNGRDCHHKGGMHTPDGYESSVVCHLNNSAVETCTICNYGVCRTTTHGKDYVSLNTTNSNYTSCNATGCNHCYAYDVNDGGCHFVPHSSKFVCESGVCHYEYEPRGKRETGVQSTTKNCVNGRCIVCVNGQCNEMRNRKREQNHSSSTTCTDGHCTRCINGSCTHYRESGEKIAE